MKTGFCAYFRKLNRAEGCRAKHVEDGSENNLTPATSIWRILKIYYKGTCIEVSAFFTKK